MPSDRALAELWLEAQSAEIGTAPSSIETYRYCLDCYLGFIATRGLTLEQVQFEDVIAYLGFLDGKGLADATIALRRAVVRTLHRFLVVDAVLTRDPTIKLDGMKRGRRLPTVLSVDEVERILETAHALAAEEAEELTRARRARAAALLETMYASGMRVTEAVTLPASVLKNDGRSIVIMGKGRKERLVMLTDHAVSAMRKWRARATALGVASPKWLFHQVRSGETALTRKTAFLEIKEIAAASGINRPERVSPHKLRHAFATHLLSAGADLRSIQAMLGHADLGTTEIYTHVDLSRAQAMVVDLHPLGDPG